MIPSQEELANFLGSVPSPTTQQLAGLLRGALTPASNPLTLKLFEENSGTFPFSGAMTQASFRLDHRFSDYHNVFLRGSIAKDLNENSEFGALVGVSRGREVDLLDSTLVLSDTYIFSPRWVMDTRAMFSYGEVNVTPNDPNGPELSIGGFGFFNRDIFLPSYTIERHWQLRQSFSYIGGKHDVKFGYDFNPVRDAVYSETFFSGRFGFGEAVPLGALINSATADPQGAAKLGGLLAQLGRPAGQSGSAFSRRIPSGRRRGWF